MALGNNLAGALAYVKINPNFASRPALCEKMFLCCFFSLQAGSGTQARKSTPPHPTPPPSVPPNDVKRILAVFFAVQHRVISHVSKFSTFS